MAATLGTAAPGTVLYEHMFVEYDDRRSGAGPVRKGTGEPLALLAERTRPVSPSQARLLPALPPLVDLLPDGGLRRGSTIVVSGGSGGTAGAGVSMALALVAAASGAGSWCVLVGLAGLGAVAARDLGVDLARLAVVPRPGAAWPEVVATLAGGVDLVVLHPPFPPRPAMAARVAARVRERRSVLVVLAAGRSMWPEPPDVQLTVDAMGWDGAGAGEGYLRRRRVSVSAVGRRAASRPRRRRLWLPSTTGEVTVADAADPAGGRDEGAVGEGAVGEGAVDEEAGITA